MRSEKTRRGQEGQVILEAAVILLPFLAIFLAIMDFGMAMFFKNTMQFAVREGVRYAVTSQTQSGLGHDASIKAVVSRYSFGFLNYVAPTGVGRPCSGQGCISIRYFRSQTNPVTGNPELVEVTGVGSNAGGNVVQISADNLTYGWMAPLMRSATALRFSVSSADLMEPSPLAGIPAR